MSAYAKRNGHRAQIQDGAAREACTGDTLRPVAIAPVTSDEYGTRSAQEIRIRIGVRTASPALSQLSASFGNEKGRPLRRSYGSKNSIATFHSKRRNVLRGNAPAQLLRILELQWMARLRGFDHGLFGLRQCVSHKFYLASQSAFVCILDGNTSTGSTSSNCLQHRGIWLGLRIFVRNEGYGFRKRRSFPSDRLRGGVLAMARQHSYSLLCFLLAHQTAGILK